MASPQRGSLARDPWTHFPCYSLSSGKAGVLALPWCLGEVTSAVGGAAARALPGRRSRHDAKMLGGGGGRLEGATAGQSRKSLIHLGETEGSTPSFQGWESSPDSPCVPLCPLVLLSCPEILASAQGMKESALHRLGSLLGPVSHTACHPRTLRWWHLGSSACH